MQATRHRVMPKIVLILAACLVLVTPVLAQVSAAFDLSWHVIGGGGGQMSGPGHTIAGTVGQPTIGTTGGSGHTLCSGFWCGIPAEYRVFLPLVLR